MKRGNKTSEPKKSRACSACGALLRSVPADALVDHQTGKTLSLEEYWAKVDAGPHWDHVLTEMEMDDAKVGTRSLTFALGTLEELSRAAKHYLENPSQSNRDRVVAAMADAQVVLTSHIVDVPRVNIDAPTMDEINAEVKAVRRARAKRVR